MTPYSRRHHATTSVLNGIRANTLSVRAGARLQRAFTSNLSQNRACGGSSNEVHCAGWAGAASCEDVWRNIRHERQRESMSAPRPGRPPHLLARDHLPASPRTYPAALRAGGQGALTTKTPSSPPSRRSGA